MWRVDPGSAKIKIMITLSAELEQEEDGRWIAEIAELPGVLAYGKTAEDAQARAQALALRVVADRLDHGEIGNATFFRSPL
jgi:predicted RNase H-like HicB family nuclease